MGNDEQKSDKPDTQNARKGGPLTPAQRERKQKQFLKFYAECGNIKASCKAAKISRSTFYEWRDTDAAFKAALNDAEPDVNDTLEYAAYDRAVHGVESFVVSMGRIVCEETLLLDKEGKPQLDGHNKPIMVPGKPIKERKYSDQLLITLLKARMPKKYKDQQAVEVSGGLDITGARDLLFNKLAAFQRDQTDQQQQQETGEGRDGRAAAETGSDLEAE